MENIEYQDFGGPNKISNPAMVIYASQVDIDYLKKYNIEVEIFKDSLGGWKMEVEVRPFNIIVPNDVSDRLERIFKQYTLVQNKEKDCLYFSDDIDHYIYRDRRFY